MDSACILAQTPSTQPGEQALEWLQYLYALAARVPWQTWLWIIGVGLALMVLRRVWWVISRAIRRRRPVNIHPSLAKYNVDRVELQKRQRELAIQVIATSTSNRLAGYRLLRQVEAVFVEGFASPEDSLIALKATAADRGANAILNVKTEHTAAGRCTASGDAVVVTPLTTDPGKASNTPPAPPPQRIN